MATHARNLRRSLTKIAKTAKQMNITAGPDANGIKVDDVIKFLPMCELYHHLSSTQRNRGLIKNLRKTELKSLHEKLTAEKNLYPELADCKGDSGIIMMNSVTKPISELVSSCDESEPVVSFPSDQELIDFIYSHLDYNFFKRFRKKYPDAFHGPEQKFKAIVERYLLIGRYTWNAFTEKAEKEVVDIEFMEEYA